MRQNIFSPLAIILILFIGSCATSSFVQTGQTYPPLEKDTYVKVFMENKEIENMEEIGVVELVCSDPPPSLNQIVEQAKEEARKRGGNCVILFQTDKFTTGSYSKNGGGINTQLIYRFKIGKIIQ